MRPGAAAVDVIHGFRGPARRLPGRVLVFRGLLLADVILVKCIFFAFPESAL